jgi:hypothetical protein
VCRAIGAQQGVFAPHARVTPHQRDHELVPDRLGHVDFVVLRGTQVDGPLANARTARIVHAAGVDEGGVDFVTLPHQVQHTVAGVQAAGEGQHNVFFHSFFSPQGFIDL